MRCQRTMWINFNPCSATTKSDKLRKCEFDSVMYKTANLYLLHNGKTQILFLLLCSAHNLWYISSISVLYDTSENNGQRTVLVWTGIGHRCSDSHFVYFSCNKLCSASLPSSDPHIVEFS